MFRAACIFFGVLGLLLLPSLVARTFHRIARTVAAARGAPLRSVDFIQPRVAFWSWVLTLLILPWWLSIIGYLFFQTALLLWSSRILCGLCFVGFLASVVDIRKRANEGG